MESILKGQAFQFRILENLFESENTKVYRALRRDPKTKWQNQCVLKILKSKNLVEDCVLEFSSIMAVNSPFCLRVHSWEWIEGRPAIVTEFVEALDLAQLTENETLSRLMSQEILRQVSLGLKDLWKQGLLHGDLSLKNILVNTQGQIKLIDYGMANINSDRAKYSIDFAAPEVIARQVYSKASDVYALGKVALALGIPEKQCGSMLSINPNQRFLPEFKGNVNLQQQLAGRVKKLKQKRIQPTKAHVNDQLNGGLEQFLKPIFAVILIFFFIAGSANESLNTKWAWLSVKSQKWHKLSSESSFLGYAPFEKVLLPANTQYLHWSNKNSAGQLALTLKPGEHKILSKLHP